MLVNMGIACMGIFREARKQQQEYESERIRLLGVGRMEEALSQKIGEEKGQGEKFEEWEEKVEEWEETIWY